MLLQVGLSASIPVSETSSNSLILPYLIGVFKSFLGWCHRAGPGAGPWPPSALYSPLSSIWHSRQTLPLLPLNHMSSECASSVGW